ncbi:hypothetical protein [Polymorphum gilvum]|uniref:Uncharacterized protein n=1 Tax=Polymorphum gilvum (strain LMG 25793 / CGMCC 1.9160 / SL003B-26A1) TaxID=991905 RepID=F2J5F0_POLGS|nr:hypothetical protein [Polymorphum gilvum]ADZ72320.1 hypothetical protein SL003B_3900 [Polymorphum gilvum SL003B-26A1]
MVDDAGKPGRPTPGPSSPLRSRGFLSHGTPTVAPEDAPSRSRGIRSHDDVVREKPACAVPAPVSPAPKSRPPLKPAALTPPHRDGEV